MTSYVDDGTEAADSKEFYVFSLTSVAVIMGPHLIGGGFCNVMHHVVTENRKYKLN